MNRETLRHVFKNVADNTDGCDEGNSWTLDTAVLAYGLSASWDSQERETFSASFCHWLLMTCWNLVSTSSLFCKKWRTEWHGSVHKLTCSSTWKFCYLRGAAAAVQLPQLKVKVLTTTNNPLHLKNDFVKYLHEKQLGWSIDTVELPYYPVCTLWDVGLWLYCSVFYNNQKWLLQWEALINKTKNKKSLVPCLILLMALGQKPVIKFVWPYVLAPFTRSTLNCHINSIL